MSLTTDGWHFNRVPKKNNPNDKIGQRIAMQDLCVKNDPQSAAPFLPNNGEYIFDGTSDSCNYCYSGCEPARMVYGDGRLDQGTGFSGGGGQFPNYKRIAYNADKTACCNSGAATIGNVTCDPEFRNGVNSEKCSDIYDTKCNSGAMGDNVCRKWCDLHPDKCKTRIREYCKTGNNMNLQYCRDQAKSIGGMDEAVTNWCSTHQDDAFCSCYKATFQKSNEELDAESRAILARPECYLTSCSSGSGYKYDNMKNPNCPSVNLCKNTVSVINSSDVNVQNVTQGCNQSISTNSGASNVDAGKIVKPGAEPSKAVTKTKFQIFIDKYLYYIIFFVVLLVVLGIGAAVAFSGDDDTNSDQHFLDLLAMYNKKPSIQMQKVETLPSADSTTTLNEL